MSLAKIRIQFPNRNVVERSLAAGTYLIGRDAGDIVLGDANVSGRHAELVVDPSGGLTVRDIGSTNGTYDGAGNRLAAPLALSPNQWVRMGESTITLLPAAAAPGGTQLMPQVPVAAAPMPAPAAYAAAPNAFAPPAEHTETPPPAVYTPPPPAGSPQHGFAGGLLASGMAAFAPSSGGASAPKESSVYSHPDAPVRHEYPVVQQGFGFVAALGLLMKTSPFIVARLGVLTAVSAIVLVTWIVAIAGFIFLAKASPLIGVVWLIAVLGGAGWIWRTVVRYFLHLLKAAHIAVLTEVITHGRVGNGSEGMFAYGKRIVTERFGEVNILFAVDLLVDGIVGAFNRTLDWVSNLIPIPGLDSAVGFVKAVLRASTTYIDETIFSYNLARGDANVWRSSKDGLVYYAQNSREILKTGILVVILERVLSFVVFWVAFLPVLAFVYLLPSSFGVWLPVTAFIAGLLIASNVRQAFLKPLFLTMLMLRFHSLVRGQAIDPVWDERLEQATGKFRELKDKAASWIAGPSAPRPAAPAVAAE